jgi:hypothetical protein
MPKQERDRLRVLAYQQQSASKSMTIEPSVSLALLDEVERADDFAEMALEHAPPPENAVILRDGGPLELAERMIEMLSRLLVRMYQDAGLDPNTKKPPLQRGGER